MVSAIPLDSETLEIIFEGGKAVRLTDDSKQYESVVTNLNNQFLMI